MKFKFLLRLLLLFTVHFGMTAQAYTVIEGEIKVPASEEVTVTLIDNHLNGEKLLEEQLTNTLEL